MNVIATICRAAGISPEALSRKLNIDAAEALGETPPPALQILSAFGATVRLELGELDLWIAMSAIDRLRTDDAWRLSVAMCPNPKTKADLRAYMGALRDNGLSYAEIADQLQANFIPTGEGLRTWRRTNVGQYLNSKAEGELFAGPEVVNAFRLHAMHELIAAMTWFAPTSPMVFEIEPVIGSFGCGVVARKSMPQFMCRWIVEAVADLGWFTRSEWGAKDMFERPAPSDSAHGSTSKEEGTREAA